MSSIFGMLIAIIAGSVAILVGTLIGHLIWESVAMAVRSRQIPRERVQVAEWVRQGEVERRITRHPDGTEYVEYRNPNDFDIMIGFAFRRNSPADPAPGEDFGDDPSVYRNGL